jgi:cation:H+ antiporter
MLVGILVLSVGTSLPEFVVSILAAIQGYPLLAAGNVIGSNIANIGLVVGLAALLGDIHLSRKTVNYDIPLSIAPIGVFVFGVIMHSVLTTYIGIALILAYIGYLGFTAKEYGMQIVQTHKSRSPFTFLDLGLLLCGLAMLLVGGEITLRYADIFFSRIGFSNTAIGAVVLALGTSFPELVATLMAVIRRDTQIAIGNILGSNVFNILFVLGSTALITPIDISRMLEEIVFLGVISLLFIFVAKTGRRHVISRHEGALLLFMYAVYVGTIMLIVR